MIKTHSSNPTEKHVYVRSNVLVSSRFFRENPSRSNSDDFEIFRSTFMCNLMKNIDFVFNLCT